MSAKFITGFLAGIILVVSCWYFFPDIRESFLHDGQTEQNISLATAPEEKKGDMSETNLQSRGDDITKSDFSDSMETAEDTASQNAVEKQIKSIEKQTDAADAVTGQGNGEMDMEKQIQVQNRVSWAEVERSSHEVEKALAVEGEPDRTPKHQTDTEPDLPAMADDVSETNTSTVFSDKTDDPPDKKDIESASTTSDGEEKFFFWKPFFLESKAKKFAAYITSGSKVTCFVDKVGTGNYQVYYRYKDEADKLDKAELIKSIGITF